MNVSGRSWRILVALLVLLSVAAGPAVAAGGTDFRSAEAGPAHSNPLLAANNTTVVQQENPDGVGSDDGSAQLEGWLASQLASRLQGSSRNISRGQYEAASEMLGDDYRERYSQYVEVTGGDGSKAESFERARENQRELANATRRYRETYEQYRRAKRNNDTRRARELARNLSRLSERVNDNSRDLQSNLGTISNETGGDVSEANRTAGNVSRNVSRQQEQVEKKVFEETSLSALTRTERASFSDPLVVDGHLRAQNGTGVERELATFRIGGRTIETPVDADGRFRLEYRPTTLPLNATSVALRYVPKDTSIYHDSETTVAVSPSQVSPEVRVDAPERGAYGRELNVMGFVGLGDEGAGGVPVVVSADGTRLGTVRTAEDGTFSLSMELPASVPTGETDLTAHLPLRNRSLAASNASTAITVEETATDLSADAARSADQLRVSGTLRTKDGRPLANRSVSITVDGRPLATAETAEDGSYVASIPFPDDADADSLAVEARFDGAGTSLSGSSARDTVSLPGGGSSGSGLVDRLGSNAPWLALLGLCVLLALGWFGSRRLDGDGEDAPPSDDGSASTSAEPSGVTARTTQASRSLLDAARDQLADGQTDRAVRTAYSAARARFTGRSGATDSLTHWEFYEFYREGGLPDEDADALRRITQAYEQAAFAAGSVPSDSASHVLDAVSTLGGTR